jgi:hypothetical protein
MELIINNDGTAVALHELEDMLEELYELVGAPNTVEIQVNDTRAFALLHRTFLYTKSVCYYMSLLDEDVPYVQNVKLVHKTMDETLVIMYNDIPYIIIKGVY